MKSKGSGETRPIIGIVGGMGIEATEEFTKLFRLAAKELGYDGESHIPPTIVDNTLKPDRSAFLLGIKDKWDREPLSPVPDIIDGCNGVAQLGASLIFMPCNTAHAFLDDINIGSSIPIISLIDSTHWYIQKYYKNTKEVGLLATNGSIISKKVFHPLFETCNIKDNINIVVPDEETQETIMNAIYDENGVKEGKTKDTPINDDNVDEGQHPTTRFLKGVENINSQFKQKHSESRKKIFIAGCTEVPLALLQSDMPDGMILIDPMKIAAFAAVIICHDRDLQEYLRKTNVENRDKKTVYELATNAFKERRPITPSVMNALEDKVAERYKNKISLPIINTNNAISLPISIKIKESSSSSAGESPSVSRSYEEKELSNDYIKRLLNKHNCFVESGKAGVSKGESKNVLRIKFASKGQNILSSKDDVVILEQSFREKFDLEHHSESRLHFTKGCSITLPDSSNVRSFFGNELGVEIKPQQSRSV